MEKLAYPDLDGDALRWSVPVSRWSVWQAPGESELQTSPDVSFVEASLRRRLSLLARISLKVAHDCASDIPAIRMVFASRHGDLGRTTAMLADLADEQILSPTTFSMSVLNACTGIYSIVKKDHSPSTAVSAAESSLGYGLLEACLQLASDPQSPVLFVYADEPAPPIYGIETGDVNRPLAIGILLQNDAKNWIDCVIKNSDKSAGQVPQSESLLQCLNSKGTAAWQGEGKIWNWSWHEQKA